jgi:uncharacterized protein (DUF1501 family)
MVTRRVFVKNGALTAVGLGILPDFLCRAALAAETSARKKVLVTIFLRGAADGLNIVVPFGDKDYAAHRPSIGIPAPVKDKPSGLELDGFFAFHPSLQPVLPLYKEGRLAAIHATGSHHTSRSHFEAQDLMESGAGVDSLVNDGWLNRYLVSAPDPKATPFRAMALSPNLPRALTGRARALAMRDLSDAQTADSFKATYSSLYDQETNSLISGTAKDMFGAVETLKSMNLDTTTGGVWQQLATLIKSDVGLEIAAVDIPGWDTHNNQGGIEPGGALRGPLNQLATGLLNFYRALGNRVEDVVVLTMSEFGRTVKENGSGGTDHGHGNVIFVMGGPVQGGKVYGKWPGLAKEQLYEERDLAITTDYRDVFAAVLQGHLGTQKLDSVFPRFKPDPTNIAGLIRTPA